MSDRLKKFIFNLTRFLIVEQEKKAEREKEKIKKERQKKLTIAALSRFTFDRLLFKIGCILQKFRKEKSFLAILEWNARRHNKKVVHSR